MVAWMIFLGSPGWSQWGTVRGEQIEDVFLRNDGADLMQAATAAITIQAASAAGGHIFFDLRDAAGSKFLIGWPGYMVGASTAALKFEGSNRRAIPIAEDNGERPKQVIYYGTCSDGSITYTSDGFRIAYASGSTPIVTFMPVNLSAAAESLYWYNLTSSTNTGFTYKIYQWFWDGGGNWDLINSNITSTKTVHWQAMGWVN